MVRVTVKANVPESRQIVINLPPEVPTGEAEVRVEVGPWPPPPPFETKIDPEDLRASRRDRPRDPKLAREFDAFERLLPELLRTHRREFVAIHEGRVVGSGPDKSQVALRAYEEFGYQPILVRLVTEQPPPPVRIPSVWHVPRRGG